MSTKHEERIRIADEALEKADIQVLHAVYEQAEQDVVALIDGLGVLARSDKYGPRPSNDAIFAMRDVALKAIELAKMVATDQKD